MPNTLGYSVLMAVWAVGTWGIGVIIAECVIPTGTSRFAEWAIATMSGLVCAGVLWFLPVILIWGM